MGQSLNSNNLPGCGHSSGMPNEQRNAAAAAAPEGYELVGFCWPGPYGWLMTMHDDGGDPPLRDGLRPMYAPLASDEQGGAS